MLLIPLLSDKSYPPTILTAPGLEGNWNILLINTTALLVENPMVLLLLEVRVNSLEKPSNLSEISSNT